jgi:hypothetical protein
VCDEFVEVFSERKGKKEQGAGKKGQRVEAGSAQHRARSGAE